MPRIPESSYNPPFHLRSGHLQTILPLELRKVRDVRYTRSRLPTPDGDFLDLDWSKQGAPRCAVLFHGLEGHAQRAYMLGMTRACNRAGWDAVAVNLRGCSGEPNLLPRAYHQGSSDDVASVTGHVAKLGYDRLILIGFSLGANIVLKYLGENVWNKPDTLSSAVAISAPCDLPSCAENLTRGFNRLYLRYFISMLCDKLIDKQPRFPGTLSVEGIEKIRTFKEFDDRFTAPLNGFTSAEDYWTRCSSLPLLSAITLPTLILSALDDPILTPQCFPCELARNHPSVFLETPRYGGHVGFMGQNSHGNYWHEERALQFCEAGAPAS